MPKLSGRTAVLSMDNNQLLRRVPYRKYLEYEDGNGIYVNISSLDHSPRSFRLWHHFKVLRTTIQVRQHGDHVFADIFNILSTRIFPADARLPFQSTSIHSKAYKWLWGWYTTSIKQYVRPDRFIIFSTNALVD